MGQTSKETRGVRNNNPMNIRRSTSLWVGKVKNGTEREFEQFHEMWQGLRAAMYLLTRYHRDYHWHTLKAIISHWAPASDGNNVEAYVGYVESECCFSKSKIPMGPDLSDWPDRRIPLTRAFLYRLVKAMCYVESKYRPETKELDKAWRNLPVSFRTYWVPQS